MKKLVLTTSNYQGKPYSKGTHRRWTSVQTAATQYVRSPWTEQRVYRNLHLNWTGQIFLIFSSCHLFSGLVGLGVQCHAMWVKIE